MLHIKEVSKQFGHVKALDDVNMTIEKGEVHGLVGENGAGKSTLIKILTGVYHMTSGEIVWNGQPVVIDNANQSRKLGINVIHQERHLIPTFDGIENVFLGLEYEKTPFRTVAWGKMEEKVRRLAEKLGIEVDLHTPASLLTPPQKTLIEILRAMMTECQLLILDEPTASLTDKETEILFNAIEALKEQGTAVLYVTHRMDEIFRLTDRITVLKNGQRVNTVHTRDVNVDKLVAMMTDNWQSQRLSSTQLYGKEILKISNLSSRDGIVKDVSFSLKEGEILGVFGLGGSGRTETLECIYGHRPSGSGQVELEGKPFISRTPSASIQKGMVLICEDRRGMALVTSLSVQDNVMLSTIDDVAKFGVVMDSVQAGKTEEKIRELSIKTTGPQQKVEQLSGGNQQKVVFAKALMSSPKVLLCDEPTQAVDIKTRTEIHNLLRTLADNQNGIVFVSSDLKEVLEVADNVLVIVAGRSKSLLQNDGLTSEQVLALCYDESN